MKKNTPKQDRMLKKFTMAISLVVIIIAGFMLFFDNPEITGQATKSDYDLEFISEIRGYSDDAKIELLNDDGEELEIYLFKDNGDVILGEEGYFLFGNPAENVEDSIIVDSRVNIKDRYQFIITDGEGGRAHLLEIRDIQGIGSANTAIDIRDLTSGVDYDVFIDTSGDDSSSWFPGVVAIEWDKDGDDECGAAGDDAFCLFGTETSSVLDEYIGGPFLQADMRIDLLQDGVSMYLQQGVDDVLVLFDNRNAPGLESVVQVFSTGGNVLTSVSLPHLEEDDSRIGYWIGTRDSIFAEWNEENEDTAIYYIDSAPGYEANIVPAPLELSPEVFFEECYLDMTMLLGNSASPFDTIAMNGLLPYLQNYYFDECGVPEIPVGTTQLADGFPLFSTNMILVGEPETSSAVRSMFGVGATSDIYTGHDGFVAMFKEENTGKYALVMHGETNEAKRLLPDVVQEIEDTESSIVCFDVIENWELDYVLYEDCNYAVIDSDYEEVRGTIIAVDSPKEGFFAGTYAIPNGVCELTVMAIGEELDEHDIEMAQISIGSNYFFNEMDLDCFEEDEYEYDWVTCVTERVYEFGQTYNGIALKVDDALLLDMQILYSCRQ